MTGKTRLKYYLTFPVLIDMSYSRCKWEFWTNFWQLWKIRKHPGNASPLWRSHQKTWKGERCMIKNTTGFYVKWKWASNIPIRKFEKFWITTAINDLWTIRNLTAMVMSEANKTLCVCFTENICTILLRFISLQKINIYCTSGDAFHVCCSSGLLTVKKQIANMFRQNLTANNVFQG